MSELKPRVLVVGAGFDRVWFIEGGLQGWPFE